MATKEEETNKQLKQLEKLTPEQIANALRLWLNNENEDSTTGPSKAPVSPK